MDGTSHGGKSMVSSFWVLRKIVTVYRLQLIFWSPNWETIQVWANKYLRKYNFRMLMHPSLLRLVEQNS